MEAKVGILLETKPNLEAASEPPTLTLEVLIILLLCCFFGGIFGLRENYLLWEFLKVASKL